MPSPQYDYRHQQLRAWLLPRVRPTDTCPQVVRGKVCGRPLLNGEPLDLGHAPDGGYLGLVHRSCNRIAGAINGYRAQQASRRRRGRRW